MDEIKEKRWVVNVHEANDGSGELVIPFTDEQLEEVGWKLGDTIEWINNNDGTWSLKKKFEFK